MGTTFTKRLATAALAALPCAQLAAQADVDPFDWAYAVSLGTGVYRGADGTETKIFRGNFSVRLRKTPETSGSGPGVRLLLPVAVGLHDLGDDLLAVDQPTDAVEIAAFLPGLELEHRLGERWTLRSRAQLGRAKELEGTEQSVRVAALGVRGRVDFDSAPGKPALITGLLWTISEPREGERSPLLRASAGVEFDIRAARWRVRDSPMHWRPHLLKDWYYRPAPTLATGDDDDDERLDDWQLGVAAAREDGFKIWFMKFDAVGVAYRFSDRGNGVRIYLNSVF